MQQAASVSEEIIKIDPNNIFALHFLGIVYQQLQNYDAAIKYLKIALELDYNNFEGYYNLARVYQKKGELYGVSILERLYSLSQIYRYLFIWVMFYSFRVCLTKLYFFIKPIELIPIMAGYILVLSPSRLKHEREAANFSVSSRVKS